jgi:hypothetical protein
MPSDLRRAPDFSASTDRGGDRGTERGDDPALAAFRTELQAMERRIAKRVGTRIWLAMGTRIWLAMLLTWIVLGGLAVVLFAAVALGR